MTRESSLERFFHDNVRKRGGMAIKMAPTVVGVPDRLVILPGGQMHLVELKTETGRLSPIQKHWHEKVRTIGAEVIVLYGKEQIKEWLREVMPDVE